MGAWLRYHLESANGMKRLLDRGDKVNYRVINFSDDCQNQGMNMTVRRGVRKAFVFKPGDIATIKGPKTILSGKVVAVKIMRFCDITEEEIRVHHLIRGKNDRETNKNYLAGLMDAIYSDFDQNEICTLIFYQVNGKAKKMERM